MNASTHESSERRGRAPAPPATPPAMPDAACIGASRHLRAALASAGALVSELDDALYAAAHPPLAQSSIGAHLRHVIEHVEALLGGLAEGRVDYDARPRDERVERSRRHALERLDALEAALERLEHAHDPGALVVRQDGGGDARAFAPSSLARELALLASHTIHHLALVAFVLRHAGREVPEGLGVARSTLEWWRSRAESGRPR